MNTLVKTSPAAVLATLLLLAPAPSALAQKQWNANDGNWSDGENWSPTGAPTTGNVVFGTNSQSTDPTIDVTVSGAATVGQLFVDFGKTVNLQFTSGSSLSTGTQLWQLNTKYITSPEAPSPAASHLNLYGPGTGTATVSAYAFQLGGGSVDAGGSTLTFSGPGLIVKNSPSGGSATVVGRSSNGNVLSVENGANVTLHGLWISQSTVAGQGYKDNRAVVDNASLTINGGAGNSGLYIGSLRTDPGSSTYENGLQNNSLTITNNGKVTVTTGNQGSSAGPIRIGFTANARSNFLSVNGGGELLITSSNALHIGDTSPTNPITNRGGNMVTIGNGGTVRTNGIISVNPYDTTVQNDGMNRLLIESGGKLYSSNTVTVHGLLRLEEGGILDGQTPAGTAASLALSIEDGALFEAAGSGLGKNVNTTIKGGTLSVGVDGHATAATLTLASSLTFADKPGTLSLSLFSDGTADSIAFASTGSLILNNTSLMLTLEDYNPQAGDSWTLFTGQTGNITGLFDLSMLPTLAEGLEWDTSTFNTAGEWRIAVIPEPGTTGLAALSLSCILLFGAAKRRLVLI